MPFVFYTNGCDIYFWDTEKYPPRKIHGFPTRKDLERMLFLRKNETPLSQDIVSMNSVISYIADIGPNGSNEMVSKNADKSDKEDKDVLFQAVHDRKTETVTMLHKLHLCFNRK